MSSTRSPFSLVTSLFLLLLFILPFLLRPVFTTNTNLDAVYGPPTEFDAFWEEYLREESVWWKRIWSRTSDFDDVDVDAYSPSVRVWTPKDTRPIFAPTSLARKYPAAFFFGYEAPTVTVPQYFAPTATHSQPRAAPSRPSRPYLRTTHTYDRPRVFVPKFVARLPAVHIGSSLLGVLFTCFLLLVLEIPCRCREIVMPVSSVLFIVHCHSHYLQESSRQAEVDVSVPAVEDVPVLECEILDVVPQLSDIISPSIPVVAPSPPSVKADDVVARAREEPASFVVHYPPRSSDRVRSATEPAPAPSKTPFTTQILETIPSAPSAFGVPESPTLPLSTRPFEPLEPSLPQPYALITALAGSVYPPPPGFPMTLPREPDFFYKSWGTAAPQLEPSPMNRRAPEPQCFYETGPRPTTPSYLKDTANILHYQARRASTTDRVALSSSSHRASQRPLPPSRAPELKSSCPPGLEKQTCFSGSGGWDLGCLSTTQMYWAGFSRQHNGDEGFEEFSLLDWEWNEELNGKFIISLRLFSSSARIFSSPSLFRGRPDSMLHLI
ncbi:hypothetical protein R3P38DRAFT_3089139 [Favolaschia claudopus]|uniref:Transmembrane protein n=1 Tax=Favolaschia claudopus TaxID=2862362 RepID=A0AAV9ZUB9_9AGAR